MASVTYERILNDVEQLTREEQRQLFATLKQRADYVPDAIETLRKQGTQPVPPTGEQRAALDAWFARADAIADQASTRWDDPNISAVDAVREQRNGEPLS